MCGNRSVYVSSNFSNLYFSGVLFHQLLSDYVGQQENRGLGQPYVVIADIKDAFGSMNHSKLCKILDEISQWLPSKFTVYTLQYRYDNQRGPFSRKILTEEDETVKPNELLKIKGARFIKVQDQQVIDTKKSLKIVQRRLKLHTIQWKMGRTKNNYLIKSGVLQGKGYDLYLTHYYLKY